MNLNTGERSIMEKKIKQILLVRMALWIITAGATVYWMYWSSHIYRMGIYDVHDYAAIFRPIFGKCLLIASVSIVISFVLRRISDKIKLQMAEDKKIQDGKHGMTE